MPNNLAAIAFCLNRRIEPSLVVQLYYESALTLDQLSEDLSSIFRNPNTTQEHYFCFLSDLEYLREVNTVDIDLEALLLEAKELIEDLREKKNAIQVQDMKSSNSLYTFRSLALFEPGTVVFEFWR